ncbi:MAG: DUF5060 domain-containing protein [Prosthecobacter sp.]|nr:DUF5060 domain-containing protein [Prosthecobacter sp.]
MKPRHILLSLLFVSAGNAETITLEAESFAKQSLTDKRRWEIKTELPGASGAAYIQALPDTRQSHADKLIQGENFTDTPGQMAVLEYPIEVIEAGRYFVWARTWSANSEDNGLHFGLDGQWPESGKRWQTVEKGAWHWDCKQRTPDEHEGVPMQLWLDIAQPGKHTLMLSMREDGAAVDQILLVSDAAFRPPCVSYERPVRSNPSARSAPIQRQPDGDASITLSGELKQWHKVTLNLQGPFSWELDGNPMGEKGITLPNPFTDFAFNVTFTHESGAPSYTVPGYFAADGNAANSSADSGTVWRAHLSPDKPGKWTFATSFTMGKHAALDGGGKPISPYHGKTGSFEINPNDKTGRDFRAKGRLQYVGKHHLQFAGSKEYFLKAGPDAPETLLAYTDFDNTHARKVSVPLKTWQPHVQDWKPGDPTWQNGKGKGLIGALNYLAAKGLNVFSFLTYNAGGDGDNVWPFTDRDDKLHYDCSKLDQWGMVFDHATARGLYLHFKLQENELDDERLGMNRKPGKKKEALDGGKLGPERKLYCRELIARFGHALALNWNIGEENTQSTDEVRAMVKYLHDTDPYDHPIVIHTFPPQQDEVYTPLLGAASGLTGASLQNGWNQAHQRTLKWITESAKAGHPWVVANDEQGGADTGVPPDLGYQGYDGKVDGKTIQSPDDIRKHTLWGTLMAGGAGVEYYFGYKLPENDLLCEDFRSRDKSWDYCRIALDFFRQQNIPFQDMQNADALIGNPKNENSKYCLAKPGELYLVYLPKGGSTDLKTEGSYTLTWFNPRDGKSQPSGNFTGQLTAPDTNDWLAVIDRQKDGRQKE